MKNSLVFFVAVIAVAAVVFVLNKPEPTPAEKLGDAVQDVGEAAQDVAEEISATAEETVDAVQKEAAARADELQDYAVEAMEAVSKEVAKTSADTRRELEVLLQEWRNSGIVTDEGIDFDAAIAAINASSLDDESKSQMIGIVAFVRDLPGDVQSNMQALEKLL